MSFPRYPKYKDSGVEWLGEVPEGWEVLPLKKTCHVFPSNVDKKSYDDEININLCNYTDVYYNETIVAGMDFMAATATADQIAKFTLRAGDTIITKDSESADDIAIAAYVPEDLPGIVCGYHLSMIRPTLGFNGAFIKRLFDSRYAKARFQVLANGLTRMGLGQYALDNIKFAFPTHHEQQTIATFLDRETAKIDALVAEQENLIALLKEKRQAVISHAVNKGLDPTAPMKDSGTEWLGEVPAHWNTGPIKFFLLQKSGAIKTGPFGSHLTAADMKEGLVKVYNQRNVIDTDFEGGDNFITEEKFSELSSFETYPGDLLVTTRGTIGRAAKYSHKRNSAFGPM